jgi:RNA polymerase sigma-70 factor, ECF subfamily
MPIPDGDVRGAIPLEADDDESALITRLRQRDEAAFALLLERHHVALLRLARTYVRDPTAAEDVVQETWLGVVRGIDRFAGRASLKTWIVAILLNCARRAGQDQRSRPFASFGALDAADNAPTVDPDQFLPPGHQWAGHWAIPPEAWAPPPDSVALATELQAQLAAAIATLPPGQQQVLLLRDVEGWPAAEVGHVLALTETNQRVLLHRARAKVRRALDAYYRGMANG